MTFQKNKNALPFREWALKIIRVLRRNGDGFKKLFKSFAIPGTAFKNN